MMLKQVILQSSSPMTLDIDNADPAEVLILTSITGLDPVDLTLFTGDFARDNGYYQGRRANRRNPVFNFKINPDYVNNISVSDVREGLYRTFMEPQAGSDGLQVTLKDDKKPDRYFIGYAEKFPSEIFVQKPTAQISMICVDSYLRSVLETDVSNPAGWVSVPFTYDGSADTGVEVTLKVTAVVNQVVLNFGNQLMTLSKPSNFAVNDVIVINTNTGSRAITLNGVDVMALLTTDSKWGSLSASAMTLSTYALAPSDGKSVITRYKYRSAWWGV